MYTFKITEMGDGREGKQNDSDNFILVIDPGGYFRNFWVGMCRWDPGTLNLYQS